jgi:hypothetical protein
MAPIELRRLGDFFSSGEKKRYKKIVCACLARSLGGGLPCSRRGVAYAWRNRASMLPPGCANFDKVLLHYGVKMKES